jgi:hypothetical protein
MDFIFGTYKLNNDEKQETFEFSDNLMSQVIQSNLMSGLYNQDSKYMKKSIRDGYHTHVFNFIVSVLDSHHHTNGFDAYFVESLSFPEIAQSLKYSISTLDFYENIYKISLIISVVNLEAFLTITESMSSDNIKLIFETISTYKLNFLYEKEVISYDINNNYESNIFYKLFNSIKWKSLMQKKQ